MIANLKRIHCASQEVIKKTLVFAFIISTFSCDNQGSQVRIENNLVTPKTEFPIITGFDATKKTIQDLNTLVIALEKYKLTHRSYPISADTDPSGWVARFDRKGNINENWIPNLSPQFIGTLPRDPRADSIFEHQYMYQSNGANYKLTANHPGDCNYIQKNYPEIIDHLRDCGYGYWTPNARGWAY